MTTDSTTIADTQRCPGCGALNNCAIALGEQQCWCMTEPIGALLPTSPTGTSCYCRDCLRKLSVARNQTKE